MTSQLASSIVTWKISNISLLNHLKMRLNSPCFLLDGPLESCFEWRLFLQPNIETGNYGIFLDRKTNDCVFGSVTVPLKYQISIWKDKCIKASSTPIIYTFNSDTSYGFVDFIDMKDFDKRIKKATDEDNITIQCTIWTKANTVTAGVKLIKFTSTFPITEESMFDWEISHFCSLNITNKSDTFNMESHLGNSLSVAFLYITQDNEKVVQVEISGTVKKESIWVCCITLAKTGDIFLSEFGTLKEKGSLPYKKNLKPRITSQSVLDDTDTFLTGGSLLLNCKFTILKRVVVHDSVNSIITSPKIMQDLLIVPNIKDDLLFDGKEEYSLKEGVGGVCLSKSFSDFTIQVQSKSYPVHSVILSARSTVFNRMLCTDMKEKNKKTLIIEDLDEDTVENMLYYMYCDEFYCDQEDVASVLKLYFAADKYELYGLVKMCQEFLVEHLSTSNVFDVLEFAERHEDSWLQQCINHYFLLYEKEVSLSDEFKAFSNRNPSLAAQTWVNVMKLKYG